MTRPVLLITGASTGIGAATAKLAAPDWDLMLTYRSSDAAMEEVAAACRKSGARVETWRGDLAESGAVDGLFIALDEAFDRLDGLVNNAGIVDEAQNVADYSHARVERMMATNVTAPILVAGAAVRRMATGLGGDGGGIVNVSSAAARLASPGQYVDYAASKAAIDTFTRGLSMEVAGDGIRVNAVRPGLIETPIHAKGGIPDRIAQIGPQVPAGRAGSADEVAETILWLLSGKASYVTGALLDVSGGR